MAYTTTTLLFFGGAVFLVTALVALCFEIANMRRRTPVQVKVMALQSQPGHRGGAYLHPEFLVVSGPQAGLRKVSTAGSFPALHNTNDLIEGYLDPETNEVRSARDRKAIGWLIAGLASLGALMLAVAGQLA
ncbi:MAG: hypothetical protein GY948_05860 [Alphaproteobacteria bacterium]|nr:hypothetical protein [Alphaproteobacteria bacterium]